MGVDAATGAAPNVIRLPSNEGEPPVNILAKQPNTPATPIAGPPAPNNGTGVVELEPVPVVTTPAAQRTLPLADIVKKFAEGGLKALSADEFASLVSYTEYVWKQHQQHRPFVPAGQEHKAATVLSMVLTLTNDLKKLAIGSDQLALYLVNNHMISPDWQQIIEKLPKPSIINEPNLARLVQANTTPNNNLLGGIAIPFVAAAQPIPVAQLAAATNAVEQGTSAENPITISPGLAAKLINIDRLMDALGPDAFVLGVKGSIGADNVGLGHLLGKDATVSFLFATLTPMDLMKNGKFDPTFQPLDTTLFLSFKTPGAATATVVTAKISELNAEIGKPIPKLNHNLFGGKLIFFANARAGYTGVSDEPLTASANGGVLIRVDGVKKVITSVKSAVTKMTRTAQAVQAATAAAAAPATGGTSALAGVGTITLTELGKYALFKALTDADYYVGLAWRLQGNTSVDSVTGKSLTRETTPYGIDLEGNVTLQTEDGKWVKFNIGDLPGAFFEERIPDLEEDGKDSDKD